MYPCLLLKVLAEYDLQLCACSKRDSCVPVFLYAVRGDTRPGYISRGVGGRPKRGAFSFFSCFFIFSSFFHFFFIFLHVFFIFLFVFSSLVPSFVHHFFLIFEVSQPQIFMFSSFRFHFPWCSSPKSSFLFPPSLMIRARPEGGERRCRTMRK